MDRQIGFYDEFDELYWNVTGDGWAFPILSAEAIVLITPKAHVVQKAAYTGKRGETGKASSPPSTPAALPASRPPARSGPARG
ncbi:MAG: hypothetical protein ISR51_01150 [Rhodospirillales bacterium]|nr:hypothetical protein [Alphaproteobacteria bacterium]MBL6947257.1 hypothetical protein [Rhodospirillales bacterium]